MVIIDGYPLYTVGTSTPPTPCKEFCRSSRANASAFVVLPNSPARTLNMLPQQQNQRQLAVQAVIVEHYVYEKKKVKRGTMKVLQHAAGRSTKAKKYKKIYSV